MCNKSVHTYVFALNVPYCTCRSPSLTRNRSIFRVVLQDVTGFKELTVLHEDARILLHTTATQLDMYAAEVFLLSLYSPKLLIVPLLPSMCCSCPQPYGHLSLYAIIEDYIGNPWVFILEPPCQHEVDAPVTLIVPFNWGEEVHHIRRTNGKYTRFKRRMWIIHDCRHHLTYHYPI